MVFPIRAHGGGPLAGAQHPPTPLRKASVVPVFSGLQELPAPQELQHLPLRTPALRLRQGLQAPRRGIASYASSGWVGLTPARCVLAFSGCRAAGAARSGPLGWKEFPGPWRDCRGSIESLVSGTEAASPPQLQRPPPSGSPRATTCSWTRAAFATSSPRSWRTSCGRSPALHSTFQPSACAACPRPSSAPATWRGLAPTAALGSGSGLAALPLSGQRAPAPGRGRRTSVSSLRAGASGPPRFVPTPPRHCRCCSLCLSLPLPRWEEPLLPTSASGKVWPCLHLGLPICPADRNFPLPALCLVWKGMQAGRPVGRGRIGRVRSLWDLGQRQPRLVSSTNQSLSQRMNCPRRGWEGSRGQGAGCVVPARSAPLLSRDP
nr:zinc finger protein 580 isoform X1 [Delphinus delphis]